MSNEKNKIGGERKESCLLFWQNPIFFKNLLVVWFYILRHLSGIRIKE